MKYIVEIKPEYEDRFKGLIILGAKDSNLFVDTLAVENLEELNSDYINEHFGDMQDEAYQHGYKDCETRYCSFDACPNRQAEYRRGLEEGKKAFDLLDEERDAEYQRGLNDAWEAARKIVTWPDRSLVNSDTFDLDPGENIFTKYSASEAIEKLKAYEEKQDDKIEVGDEVLWFMKGDDEGCDDIMDVCAPSVVTMVPNKECDDYTIIESSGAMTVISKEQIYKKTGRHFDITSILEDMQND